MLLATLVVYLTKYTFKAVMKNAFYLLILVCTFGITASLQAQEATSDDPKAPGVLREADKAYSLKQYKFAIDKYNRAYKKVKSRNEKAEISFRLAECYRYTFDYTKAGNFYRRAMVFKLETPEVYLGYAEMLRYQMASKPQMYDDVVEAYQDFLKAYPNDERGIEALASLQLARQWEEAEPSARIRASKVKGDLNTEGLEFGIGFSDKPSSNEQPLYFTRMAMVKGNKKNVDGMTGMQPSDIWETVLTIPGGSSDSKPSKSRSKSRRKKGPSVMGLEIEAQDPKLLESGDAVNTKFAEGSPTMDTRWQTMYFTRCKKENQKQLGCAIYSSKKVGQNWKEPELVLAAPDSSKSIGHPSISKDELRLYFAGDLEGSVKESKDIWMVSRERRSKDWGEPVNLGSFVNTSGSELFPFYHEQSGYLYFASDGLQGMGGLDIFRVAVDKTGMPAGEPENLMAPINSSMDDFGIIVEPDRFDGYFVTNRDQKGHDDVWRFIEMPIAYQIIGRLTNAKKEGEAISGASVKLTGSDGLNKVVLTEKDGTFKFEAELFKGQGDRTYELSFEKKKFLSGTASTNTVGLNLINAVDTNLALKYLNELRETSVKLHTVRVDAAIDPIEIPVILPDVYFALAKWDLNESARASLDMVVKTMNLNPNIIIELRSHTDYRDVDERNQVLSQRRADTSVSYLISKGVDPDRVIAVGMGESQPFEIPAGYKGLGADLFPVGTQLTERNIKKMSASSQEVANQINRRTDFRVIRDDYVPKSDTSAGAAASTQRVEDIRPPKGEVYTVLEKESYSAVCKKNGINITELKKLNGGLKGVRLSPGMVLKVTPNGDYEAFDKDHRQVVAGDSFKSIAKELGMRPKELEALNPEYGSKLPIGTYIRIQ